MTLKSQARGVVIAGTHSGVGKTTVTLAVLRGLVARGLRVQPFKIGPDFIDPGYHGQISGRTSINLDYWMMGEVGIRRSFERFSSDSDMSVIESMGAVFDGEGGTERGSGAHLAKVLNLPVLLVIDIWGLTRSAAALLDGFLSFDPNLNIAGFIMNRAGSERHARMVLDALPERLRTLSFGYLLHDDELGIPERHLGLLTVEENPAGDELLSRFDSAARTLSLDALAPTPLLNRSPSVRLVGTARGERVRIAVARDAAFCFYYAENLEMLVDAGAELVPFRPTVEALPADVDGMYVGGGYPESFASVLEMNRALGAELRRRCSDGLPVYAECGGLMLLGRSLTTFDGVCHEMTDVLPLETLMDKTYLVIRYVAVRTLVSSALGAAGISARGHEFHQSRIVGPEASDPLYHVTTSDGAQYYAGSRHAQIAASYIHLHFASNPEIPRNFVGSCLKYRSQRRK